MKQAFLSLMAFVFSFSTLANAENCALEDVFVFGASISAGYAKAGDVMWGEGSAFTSVQHLLSVHNPDGNFNNENTKLRGGWYFEHTQELFGDSEETEKMKQSSLMLSMDAFYWDSIDGEASFTADNTCAQSIQAMRDVVGFAKENEIPLVLSNIPAEVGTPVGFLVRQASGWREPFSACYEVFNTELEAECLASNQCFIVDIDNVVAQLNQEENPGVLWNDETFTREDLRTSDAVHLTDLGNEYIAHLIEQAIIEGGQEHLLSCE